MELTSARQGYFLLADISGYTAFLTQSELDHAQDILRSLFETLLAEIRPPLAVAEVEGDAVFAFAPDQGFLQGQTLLSTVENLYAAFAEMRERMMRNTTCTCTACRLIPTLDLKFVVHHGPYAAQQLDPRARPKPQGPEVIRAHRLLKNEVREKTGVTAYAFLTDACVQACGLEALAAGMTAHTEHHEHLGAVRGVVYDLAPVWARERERRRVVVGADDLWMTAEAVLPLPPSLAWEYLYEPERRRQWIHADGMTITGGPDARTGLGSTYHCAHGNTVIESEIVDWRPFAYETSRNAWPMGATALITTRLIPEGKGTRVQFLIGRPTGQGALQGATVRAMYALMKKKLARDMQHSLENLRAMIAEDRAAGRLPDLPAAAGAAPAPQPPEPTALPA
ncbi:MAG TPA: DUF2652 domain-containing protein [Rubricoccaceae bacterium]|nr:DUF2652 domain-containing protein [Rubricoccaceae bacterium]